MEIKYEPVFGPQELFDCASDDAVLAIKDTTSGRIHIFTNDGWIKSGLKHERHIGTSDNQIAMRRIIKAPVWTVADQQAGRLPEVGSTFTYKNETLTCHFIDCDGEIWAHDINDRIVTPWLKDCQPIESPEERAKREREEWCSKALDSAGILSEMKRYELKRLGEYIGSIHDAMLSGELKAPKGGE